MERNRKIRLASSKALIIPSSLNLDKLSEVSMSYGFHLQNTGPSDTDLAFTRIRNRKSASVEKIHPEFEGNIKLPPTNRSHSKDYSKKDGDNTRAIKSLSKIASLPKIEEYKKQTSQR